MCLLPLPTLLTSLGLLWLSKRLEAAAEVIE